MKTVDFRYIAGALAALLLIAGAGRLAAQPAGTGGAPSERDIAGRKLAEEVVAASGGLSAWNSPSWDLSFDFVTYNDGKPGSRYSHIWYRGLDRYIVSGVNKKGKPWRVRFSSLSRQEGTGEIEGTEMADSTQRRLMQMAYGRYINDTYWFLMPLKLLDSGVYQRREADTTIGGTKYEVLTLSFAQVGLTPGDHYTLFIDPATKLVRRWHYTLQGGQEGEFIWDNYTSIGPFKLALERRSTEGTFGIHFENVKVDKAQ